MPKNLDFWEHSRGTKNPEKSGQGATGRRQSRPGRRPREDQVTNFWRSELVVGRDMFARKDFKSMERGLFQMIFAVVLLLQLILFRNQNQNQNRNQNQRVSLNLK